MLLVDEQRCGAAEVLREDDEEYSQFPMPVSENEEDLNYGFKEGDKQRIK